MRLKIYSILPYLSCRLVVSFDKIAVRSVSNKLPHDGWTSVAINNKNVGLNPLL